MAQQTTNVSEALGSIDREIAAVEGEYKAALVVAAEQLSGTETSVMRAVNAHAAARSAQRGSSSGVLVAEAPAETPELDPETAMTLHKLETRLDQLKELRAWIKIDPPLAHFVEQFRASPANPANAASAVAARSAFAGASAPREASSGSSSQHGVPVMLALLLVVLALVAGWLLSLAVPAATLLPH